MGSKLIRFADVIGQIKVEPFDGHNEMITAHDHKTIEPIGKYKNGSWCRIVLETYKLEEFVKDSYGQQYFCSEHTIVKLDPMKEAGEA